MIRLVFVILFFLVSRNSVHAQPASDNLHINTLYQKSEVFLVASKYDSAQTQLEKALTLAKKLQLNKDIAQSYLLLATLHQSMGNLAQMALHDSLAKPFLKKINDKNLQIEALNHEGIFAMEKGKNKDAEAAFNKILFIEKNNPYSKMMAETYMNLGSLNLNIGEKDKAISHFFNALKINESLKNMTGAGETLSNIASTYYLMGDLDNAIVYQEKSIAIREKINDKKGLVASYINVGQLLLLKKDYASSQVRLNKAILLAEDIQIPKLLASAYAAMAVNYIRQQNNSEGLKWQTKALIIFEKIDDKQMLSRLYVVAGSLANANKDSVAAMSFFSKALSTAQALGNKENIANAYEKISAFYYGRKEFSLAYDNYFKYTTYKDSISAKSNLSKIEEIRTVYETEKKDNEIVKLNTLQKLKQLEIEKQEAMITGNVLEAAKKQAEIALLSKDKLLLSNEKMVQSLEIKRQNDNLEKQVLFSNGREQKLLLSENERKSKEQEVRSERKIKYLLLASFVLAGLLGFAYFNRFKLKRKLAYQTELLDIRNNISRNLHDEIGSTLSSISILSNITQKAIVANPQQAQEMLQKINTQSKAVQQNMRDIVWSMNTENDKVDDLATRVKEFAVEVLESKEITTMISVDEKIVDKKLTVATRKELLLICKEAINNIAMHANATSASIDFKFTDTSLVVNILDNGSWKGDTTGQGTKNMKERAKRIGGDLSLSHDSDGTSVVLKMPIS